MAVPCQVPVVIVPVVVILAWVKCSPSSKLFNESWSISPGTLVTVIVAPEFVTPTPLVPSILKSALPSVSEALLPDPESVVIVTAVISPVASFALTILLLESNPKLPPLAIVPVDISSR